MSLAVYLMVPIVFPIMVLAVAVLWIDWMESMKTWQSGAKNRKT